MDRATARTFLSTHAEAPAARLLAGLGVTPNALTLSGLAVAGAAAYLVAQGYLAAGGAVVLLSGLFDLLDGALARATGRVSRFGALLDSVVDRVSEAVVLLGLLVHYLDEPSRPGVALVYVALAASIMVSYVRARAEGLGVECKVGLLTRPERVVALGGGLIVGWWWPGTIIVVLALIAALSIITTMQRVLEVRRALSREGEAGH